MLGPVAKEWAWRWHYGLGLSFAKAARLLGDLFGLRVTAGALVSGAHTTSKALVPVNNEIRAKLNESGVVSMDETGWRVNGNGAWLWVATTPEVIYWYEEFDTLLSTRGPEHAARISANDPFGIINLFTVN